jgi:hypothetical protein
MSESTRVRDLLSRLSAAEQDEVMARVDAVALRSQAVQGMSSLSVAREVADMALRSELIKYMRTPAMQAEWRHAFGFPSDMFIPMPELGIDDICG